MTTATEKNEAAKKALKSKENKEAAKKSNSKLAAIRYETDDKKAIDTRRFQEQCFLIDNMKKFATFNTKGTQGKKTQYRNLTVIESKDPALVVNTLVQFPGQEAFMDLKPYEFAALRPKIRLFKTYDKGGGKTEDVEIRFSDHHTRASIEAIVSAAQERPGDGVGIQELTYMFKGGNPVQVRANMECTFKIKFESLKALTANRAVDPGKKAYFIDFIRRPLFNKNGTKRKFNDNEHLKWEKKHFRMKAIVGWAAPIMETDDVIRKEVVEVARRTTRTMFLELKSHKFNFKENGSAELEMDFVGALEGALSDNKADIFFQSEEEKAKDKELKDKRAELKKKVEEKKKAEEDAGAEEGWFVDDAETNDRQEAEEELEEYDKEHREAMASSRLRRYNRLINSLIKDGRIFYQDVTAAEVGKFEDQLTAEGAALLRTASNGETRSVTKIQPKKSNNASKVATDLKGVAKTASEGEDENARKKAVSDHMKKSGGTSIEQGGNAVPAGMHRIYFFYYGDLMNTAANCLDKTEDARKVKLLAGPVIWRNPLSKKTESINLVDIPISLRLFEKFFLQRIVKPQKEKYLFLNFLNDTMGRLIAKAMGADCFAGYGVNIIRPDLVPIMAPANSKGHDKIKGSGRTNIDSLKNLQVPEYKDLSKVYHYMLAYISGIPSHLLRGKEQSDRDLGVYHLYVGKDSGLVKSVSWEKVDQPYLAESQIENAQSLEPGETPLDVERNKYNATVKMVGNNLFFPGAKIFINPIAMGAGDPSKRNSVARTLGLGGYYTVTEVKNVLTANSFETILQAKWDSFGGVKARPVKIVGVRPKAIPHKKPSKS